MLLRRAWTQEGQAWEGRRRARLRRATATCQGYRSAGAGRVRVVTTPDTFVDQILILPSQDLDLGALCWLVVANVKTRLWRCDGDGQEMVAALWYARAMVGLVQAGEAPCHEEPAATARRWRTSSRLAHSAERPGLHARVVSGMPTSGD
jgi:hypothetical protein